MWQVPAGAGLWGGLSQFSVLLASAYTLCFPSSPSLAGLTIRVYSLPSRTFSI